MVRRKAPAAAAGDEIIMISKLFIGLCALCSAIILAFLAWVLGDIVWNGAGHLSLTFIFSSPTQGMTQGGIFPAIFGTFCLVVLMTIAVIPLGVSTAVYLNEYAPKGSRFVRWIRIAVQNLAGVPAIVFGLFGLGFFINFIGMGIDKVLFGGKLVFGQPAILWASLTMALLTLPTVIVATEEALRAVPDIQREVAYSLGATRWETIREVVLPQALGGILTGGILAVSRGAGEVAPILFTGAAYFLPYLPKKLNDQFMELGYHIYVLATQSPDVEATKPILYSTVFVLLALTFSLNFGAIWIRSKIRRRLRSGR